MSVREEIALAIRNLDDAELQQVADYLAFLKFRTRRDRMPPVDMKNLEALYVDSADEDHDLAEQGMDKYFHGLTTEDEK